ncbi:MAG: DUF1127 domain-containing protein [Phyllobacteriaceae bacterium]|nr:DUF1127 domain-containing protein [Phyllobacteriaceae bacterium]
MTMQRTGFLPSGREIEYDEGSRQPGVLRQVAVRAGWLLGRLRGRFAKYRSRRALAQLDDRLLEDVGITQKARQRELSRSFWD